MVRSRRSRLVFGILAAIVVLGFREYARRSAGSGVLAPDAASGTQAIVAAFADRRSGIWVEAAGRVDRMLSDDNEGSRHQRFIVRLGSDHTLLISHNIDLAPRLPVSRGDHVSFRGMYEWNELGGVVHWTHHDPDGRHAGGWMRHDGEVYR